MWVFFLSFDYLIVIFVCLALTLGKSNWTEIYIFFALFRTVFLNWWVADLFEWVGECSAPPPTPHAQEDVGPPL